MKILIQEISRRNDLFELFIKSEWPYSEINGLKKLREKK